MAVTELSLRQLFVWTFDPLHRLKTLATVVDGCKGKNLEEKKVFLYCLDESVIE